MVYNKINEDKYYKLHQGIGKCCKGTYKSCGGFIWKYKIINFTP